MISTLPKLRTDLTICERRTAGGTFFVVKDPSSGTFFRFREAEQFIAQQCDGKTPREEMRRRTEERFGAELPPETLEGFLGTLDQKGLLESERARRKQAARKPKRIAGNPLYLRFKAFDPTRLFDVLQPRVRFMLTWQFFVFSSAVILLAIGVAAANWALILRELYVLFNPAAIPLYMTVICLVIAMHELAHGLTCRHFGGEVHEIGFMLVYFQPAFYCNVSDAWLFPEKSKRLLVGFAGPYFELFLWALATLIWRVTDTETWIHMLALIVATSSGLKTLLNFNPLIKFDGYYLLSDYLEIPNLRRRSFRYVGNLLKTLFGFGTPPVEEIPRRERRIFSVYGILAMSGSFSLLAYILFSAGGYLLEKHSPTAALLSVALVGLRLRSRFQRLFVKPSGSSGPTPVPRPADAPGAAPGASRSRKWKIGSWLRRIAWVIVLAGIGAGILLGRMQLRIGGPFAVLPRENADVRAEVEGIVLKVAVTEGDEVRAGDVIARLSDADVVTELRKCDGAIKESRARLQILKEGPTTSEIKVAEAAISKTADQLTYARSRLARSKTLFKDRLLTQKDLEDVQELETTAENDLEEARRRLTALLHRTRPEEIDALRASIEQLETQRAYLERQRRLLVIPSPADGVVATPARQLKELHGQLVRKGDLIAKVYDLKTVTAQIAVSEKEIAGLQAGLRVDLRVRAYPHITFHGAVTSIATATDGSAVAGGASSPTSQDGTGGSNRAILVTTEIDNHSLLLKPGMTGEAKILCGERSISSLIERRVARTFKVEFWSWW